MTADALHTRRDHARHLHRRGAHHVFTVKTGQPGDCTRSDSPPWDELPCPVFQERGHDRSGLRTVRIALPGVRDVTHAEDTSRVRTGNAPRHAGHTNIAKGLPTMARNPQRPLQLLGITT